jgi:hypothetical protein
VRRVKLFQAGEELGGIWRALVPLAAISLMFCPSPTYDLTEMTIAVAEVLPHPLPFSRRNGRRASDLGQGSIRTPASWPHIL